MKRFFPFLLIVLAGSIFAQQVGTLPPPPGQKPDGLDVVKITTNLVQVDAVVTDKNGKLVTDLKPEEVQIFEDNRPQKITHFVFSSSPSASERRAEPTNTNKTTDPGAPSAPPNAVTRNDVRRSIAVVVDDLGMSFESVAYVRRALAKFVAEQMQPGDLVSIIRTGGGTGTLQQFTTDKRRLSAAIEQVKFNLMGRGDVSAFAPLKAPDLKIPDEAESRNQTPENFRAEAYSVGTLGTLRYVVQGLREMPGRKSVLLLSDDLKIFNPGDANRTNRVQAALENLTNLANRASVVIYTMDARGVTPIGRQAQDNVQLSMPIVRPGIGGPMGGSRSRQELERDEAMRRQSFYESQNGLNFLAEQTGGLAIRNTNDISGGIQHVLDDQRGYYLIGYRPDESIFNGKGPRTLHHLTLKVSRAGKFEVRIRSGFYGEADDKGTPKDKTAAQQLVEMISSPFSSSDVHLQLTSLFVNDATNGSYMRSLLHIDARELTFKDAPDGNHEAVFDVVAMTFGDTTAAVDYTGQTYTIQLPEEDYQRALSQGLVYNVAVPIKKAGAYQFRIGLRDAPTGRLGSASQYIQVPDLNNRRLALSGVVLSGAATAAAQSNLKPDLKKTPEISPAVRDFRQGMQLQYGYLIYNAQLDKNQKHQLSTSLRLFRNGEQVFAGTDQPFAAKNQNDLQRLVVSGAIILGTDLTPGEYILQVVVTDALAEKKYRTATQWMDFEIVK